MSRAFRTGISYSALLWGLAATPSDMAFATPTETVLYSFEGGNDGADPLSFVGGLDAAGVLFGTTSDGGGTGCGGSGCGVVFELVPPPKGKTQWTEKVLYRFKGGDDGQSPQSGLLLDKTGQLYGTTAEGGDGACYNYKSHHSINFKNMSSRFFYTRASKIGCGTIFKLTPPSKAGAVWSETILYRFQGKDGRQPANAIILAQTGALYGVTEFGGDATACGPVSRFNGSFPFSNVQYKTGCGTVFKLSPPAKGHTVWKEAVLYSFQDGADGGLPAGLIESADGVLLGTTLYGGTGSNSCFYPASNPCGSGTLFALTPPASGSVWTETPLYSFGAMGAGTDATHPIGDLYQNSAGVVFGASEAGGNIGYGTVFQLSPPSSSGSEWTESIIYNFAGGNNGDGPSGGVTYDPVSQAIYAPTTYGGGDGCGGKGCGTAFSLAPPKANTDRWGVSILHKFGRGADGQNPQGNLTYDKAGNLYGTTASGGAHGHGTVFMITP